MSEEPITKKTAVKKRKSKTRSQRFRIDPLNVLPQTEPIKESASQFYQEEDQEIPPEQKIEILPLEMIEPDAWNPRHVLPQQLRTKYLSRSLDAETVIQRWLEFGKRDVNVGKQIQALRIMGDTLLAQGQINPVNVVKHFRNDGTFVWQIESGERRFWAKWLLVIDGKTNDKTIIAVLRDRLDATRQAVENLQSQSLTSVAESRQIARLYLERLGIDPEHELATGILSGNDDYFRLALLPVENLLSGRKRLPRGFWQALESMFGSKRQHLLRQLQILKLPDVLLQMADSRALKERQLREVFSAPAEKWELLIKYCVQHELTGAELNLVANSADYDTALAVVLEHRDDPLTTSKITQSGREKTQAKKIQISEQIISRRIVRLTLWFNKIWQLEDGQIDEDKIVDEFVLSADPRSVLNSIKRLKKIFDLLEKKLLDSQPEK